MLTGEGVGGINPLIRLISDKLFYFIYILLYFYIIKNMQNGILITFNIHMIFGIKINDHIKQYKYRVSLLFNVYSYNMFPVIRSN